MLNWKGTTSICIKIKLKSIFQSLPEVHTVIHGDSLHLFSSGFHSQPAWVCKTRVLAVIISCLCLGLLKLHKILKELVSTCIAGYKFEKLTSFYYQHPKCNLTKCLLLSTTGK